MPRRKTDPPTELALQGGRQTSTDIAVDRPTPSTPVRRAHQLKVPPVTKSGVRALECPVYFTGEYSQPISSSSHFLLVTGNEYHDWQLAYTLHLMRTRRFSDLEFKADYLATMRLSSDARSLIERDDFSVNPDEVFGAELYLSVDRQRQIGRMEFGRTHQLFEPENPYVKGVIDLLLLSNNNTHASIRDWKSGFSTTGIHDAEPIIYAALVFTWFPSVQTIDWIWEFPRLGLSRRAEYERDDLKWMWPEIDTYAARTESVVNQYNAGQELLPNAMSGLCPYCNLACPLRPRWDAGELAIGPIQTQADAERMARLVLVCEAVLQRGRRSLRAWMDQEPEVNLGAGWQATLQNTESCSYPLAHALHTIGVGMVNITDPAVAEAVLPHEPEVSPLFDIPLKSLTVGGMSKFVNTNKSRNGVSRKDLLGQLRSEGVRKIIKTKIKIGKPEVTRMIEAVHEEEEDGL